MTDYVAVMEVADNVEVCFYIDHDKVMTIGEKMNDLNEAAYMNGYNWEAFLHHYLTKNAPDILEEMDTEPEADMYVAYYPLTPENELRAKKFAEVIQSLIENEQLIYRFLQEEGDEMEWD